MLCRIIWNDDLDLSCEELFKNGETIKTPFDGLMVFTDATKLWGLNESGLFGITEMSAWSGGSRSWADIFIVQFPCPMVPS